MTDSSEHQIDQMRQDYTLNGLHESDANPDPMVQFDRWFADAIGKTDAIDMGSMPAWLEPNAMTLSTADSGGRVTNRIVLLKGIHEQQFVFYSNYESIKAMQMQQNGQVALTFYWPHLQRQVNVSGTVSQVDREMSANYFHSRPHESQLGAHVSQQSSVVDSRDVLEQAMSKLNTLYPSGSVVPLPDNWGGYAVTPLAIEFWQGRSNRLHDRLQYVRQGVTAAWILQRLSP